MILRPNEPRGAFGPTCHQQHIRPGGNRAGRFADVVFTSSAVGVGHRSVRDLEPESSESNGIKPCQFPLRRIGTDNPLHEGKITVSVTKAALSPDLGILGTKLVIQYITKAVYPVDVPFLTGEAVNVVDELARTPGNFSLPAHRLTRGFKRDINSALADSGQIEPVDMAESLRTLKSAMRKLDWKAGRSRGTLPS